MGETERESKREREKAYGLQAVKLQFVVLDQAICKHEGTVLWSWQRAKEGEKNENIERETKGKRSAG